MSQLFIVIKANCQAEMRRFTFTRVNMEALGQSEELIEGLSYDALEDKLKALFKHNKIQISYEDGDRKLHPIANDGDVTKAIKFFSKNAQPSQSIMVARVVVEPLTHEEEEEEEEAAVAAISHAPHHATTDVTKSDDLVVHENVYCDVCLNTIRGIRYKCNDCSNYDLCSSCKTRADVLHPKHSFGVIEQPNGPMLRDHCNVVVDRVASASSASISSSSSSSSSASSAHPKHLASCDICLNHIVGVRHKCYQCPDYDLCQNCLPLASIHHKGHNFIPITFPGEIDIKVDQTPHYGVVCDGCNQDIYGVRYKCGNCADYDLCGNCEAMDQHGHDPSHIMLKIRKPIEIRMAHPTPLLPIMYKKGWGKAVCTHILTTGRRCPQSVDLPRPCNKPYGNKSYSCHRRRSSGCSAKDKDTITCGGSNGRNNSCNDSSSNSICSGKTLSCNSSNSRSSYPSATDTISGQELSAKFVDDINLFDGTAMQAGSQFLKIWEMHNEGPREWPEGVVLQFVGGDRMFLESQDHVTAPEFKVEKLGVGQSAWIYADLKAPSVPGRYISYWRLVAPSGERFGHRIWCDITVEDGSESGSDSLASSTMVFPKMELHSQDESSNSAAATTEDAAVAPAAATALAVTADMGDTASEVGSTITKTTHPEDDTLSTLSDAHFASATTSQVDDTEHEEDSDEDDSGSESDDFVVIDSDLESDAADDSRI